MSDPVSNVEIEDVLSSIRRLVSENNRTESRSQRQASDPANDRLVLTPSLRVPDAKDDDDPGLAADGEPPAPSDAPGAEPPGDEKAWHDSEAALCDDFRFVAWRARGAALINDPAVPDESAEDAHDDEPHASGDALEEPETWPQAETTAKDAASYGASQSHWSEPEPDNVEPARAAGESWTDPGLEAADGPPETWDKLQARDPVNAASAEAVPAPEEAGAALFAEAPQAPEANVEPEDDVAKLAGEDPVAGARETGMAPDEATISDEDPAGGADAIAATPDEAAMVDEDPAGGADATAATPDEAAMLDEGPAGEADPAAAVPDEAAIKDEDPVGEAEKTAAATDEAAMGDEDPVGEAEEIAAALDEAAMVGEDPSGGADATEAAPDEASENSPAPPGADPFQPDSRRADVCAASSAARAQSLSAKIEALEAAIAQTKDQWEPDGAVGDDYAGTQVKTIRWRDHGTEQPAAPGPFAAAAPERPFVSQRCEPAPSGEDEDKEALDYLVSEEAVIDEDSLRELVADIVREELQGALGERITRNVRKLVRREIHRALAAQELG